jgi:hypothetical protein
MVRSSTSGEMMFGNIFVYATIRTHHARDTSTTRIPSSQTFKRLLMDFTRYLNAFGEETKDIFTWPWQNTSE